MKNMSNTAKFFIVCAVVFCVGFVTAAAGFAAGGIRGLDKVAEERDWLQTSPGKYTADHIEAGDFDKAEVEGDIDVYFATEKYFTDKKWLKDHDLDEKLGNLKGVEPKAGEVLVIRGSKIKAPEVNVKNGVLHIETGKTVTNGIHLNFSTVSTTPSVYVFCTEDELKSIEVNALSGDVGFYGISFDKTSIESASGDVLMKDVTGKGVDVSLLSGDMELKGNIDGAAAIDSASGDIDLSGNILGNIKISAASGDVEFETEAASKNYAIDVNAFAGDLKINEGGKSSTLDAIPIDYKRNGEPNKLTIESMSGDIDLTFK